MNPMNPTPFQALWIERYATLADFAEAAGTSGSMLSKVGLGQRALSVGLAHRIARALTTRRYPVTVRSVFDVVKQTIALAESRPARKQRRSRVA